MAENNSGFMGIAGIYSIEGEYEGAGEEVVIVGSGSADAQDQRKSIKENIKITKLKILMNIKKIHEETYLVETSYFTLDNKSNFSEVSLILRQGDKFISADPSGNGLNFFEFEKQFHLFGPNKLNFKYS